MGNDAQWGWVYVTFADQTEAESLARTLVEEKRIACANLLGEVQSIYRWKGKIESGQEVSTIFKCDLNGFESLRERIEELHSYECPCVVAIPFSEASPTYRHWLAEQIEES
jgi:periplasmic divalent cation tolerance protein